MTQYPSAEKVAEIVARRRELLRDLIYVIVETKNQRKFKKQMDRLLHQYGQVEVERIAVHLQNTFQRDLDNDEAWLYHDYVKYYRRFGGQRPFLTLDEYTEASEEFAKLYGQKELNQSFSADEEQGLAELNHLLLKDAYLWEDLVPEDPPAVMPEVELPLLKCATRPTVVPNKSGQPRQSHQKRNAAGKYRVEINGHVLFIIED